MPEDLKRKNLTGRQQRFIEAYVADPGNAAKAAREAGYAVSGARRMGSFLLRQPHIRQAIGELNDQTKAIVAKKMKRDAAFVLEKLEEVYDKAMTGVPVLDKEGNIVSVRYDLTNANKALEHIGKHVDIKAWLERKDITSGGRPLEGDRKLYVLRINGQDIEFE